MVHNAAWPKAFHGLELLSFRVDASGLPPLSSGAIEPFEILTKCPKPQDEISFATTLMYLGQKACRPEPVECRARREASQTQTDQAAQLSMYMSSQTLLGMHAVNHVEVEDQTG